MRWGQGQDPVEPSEEDFDTAVVVRADEPDGHAQDSITLTRTDFMVCAPEPLSLVVLLHWRSRERDGRPRTAMAIWRTLTELGVRGDDDETPVRLDEVGAAVDFLLGHGLVAAPADGGL